MDTRRYVVCGVVSVALHSLAIYASPPVPEFALAEENPGNRVSIQLVSAASEKAPPPPELKKPAVKKRPPEAPLPDEKAVDRKQHLKQKPVLTEKKEPSKAVPVIEKEKVPVERTNKENKPAAEKKPAQPETEANKQEPAKKPPLEKVQEKKETVKEEEKEKEKEKRTEQDVAVTQSASNKPVLVKSPQFTTRPAPVSYPRMAKRRGMEGKTVLEVWLDKEGNQIRQDILQSSGFELLDQAALNAVRKWQFQNHSDKGVAIAHRVKIPVRFNLD